MTSTESFFLLMKSHRESKGIEIQDIAEHTKINPKYLHAIEEGNFNILPKVYMRLFMRSYAQFIDIDADQALVDLEIHTTGKSNSTKENAGIKVSNTTSNLSTVSSQILGDTQITPKQVITAISVVVGLFLFFTLVSNLSQEETSKSKPSLNNNKDHESSEISKSPPISQISNNTNNAFNLSAKSSESLAETKKKN